MEFGEKNFETKHSQYGEPPHRATEDQPRNDVFAPVSFTIGANMPHSAMNELSLAVREQDQCSRPLESSVITTSAVGLGTTLPSRATASTTTSRP